MDKSKAKKAVKKSSSRKKMATASAAEPMMKMGGLHPEIQAPRADLQPADGYVNPYHAMGTLAPMLYTAGNMLDGYNSPQFLNPET